MDIQILIALIKAISVYFAKKGGILRIFHTKECFYAAIQRTRFHQPFTGVLSVVGYKLFGPSLFPLDFQF